MPIRTIKTRTQLKRDSHAHFMANNPVLLEGEMVVVYIDDNMRIKIGDGVNKYAALPFVIADETFDAIANISNDVSAIAARMNTITALPNGSTSGDAELADVRVALDGTVYSSAGAAVRGEIAKVKENTGTVEEFAAFISGGAV